MNKKFSVVIRTPKKEDVPTLVQWGTSTPELWPSNDSTWHSKESLVEWIDNPGQDVLLVAAVNKKLAGMCFTYHMGDWAYFSSLYVDKKYRKLGIGKTLVEEAHRKMESKGIHYLALLVNINNSGGKKFYEKLGFQKGFDFTWMYRRNR